MSEPFFIAGTPRSRTAWLAAVLSSGQTLCFHEPSLDLEELVRIHPERRIGLSGPSLVFQWERLRTRFPVAPWIYVERDAEEALASLLVFLRPHYAELAAQAPGVIEAGLRTLMERHQEAAQRLKREPWVKVIPFEELDERTAAIAAWEHLLPDQAPDLVRWNLMAGLRIEQHAQKAVNRTRYLCR